MSIKSGRGLEDEPESCGKDNRLDFSPLLPYLRLDSI